MKILFLLTGVLCALQAATALAVPTNVVVSNIGAQTVGSSTFYSSTQLAVAWTPQTGEAIDHYIINATESVMNTTVSMNPSSIATSATLKDLKAATTYSVTVKACNDNLCSSATTSAAATGRTSEEYWQLQGAGNSYPTVTKTVNEGSVLSWVIRWGNEAGANAGSYQYYYKTLATGREGIAIATANGTSSDAAAPIIPFTPITTAGLRSACSSAPGTNTSSCPATGAYEINALQAVPMTNGNIRVFFEASDVKNNKTTRIYSLDSRDGLTGQDFHPSATQSYCGGFGSSDYSTGGPCEPTLLVDVSAGLSGANPLLNARQFKIGYDWNADWRWDGANGTFMVITGEDTCKKYTSGLFYATWNGSTWSVLKDSSNCANPLVPLAHGPVLVPLGGVAYKLYYEDATNGQSGKPLRLLFGDGVISGDTARVDFDDWENSSNARQVNFLWPDGSLLDAQDESGLGDHMILTPTGKLDKQLMFLNLGGMDNTKWNKGSAGLGMAILLNSYTQTGSLSDLILSSTSQTLTSAGGTASVTITDSTGAVSWTATSTLTWVTILSGSSGTGSGTVTISVSANTTGATKTGNITIAGQTFTITQVASQSVSLVATTPAAQSYFNTIQAAYDANTATSGSTIKVQGTTLTETLVFNQNNTLTLTGGYESSFTTVGSTMTTVSGSLTISGGTVTVANIVIQ